MREQINIIDDKILELLNGRMEVVQKIAKLKLENDAEIFIPAREKEVIDRLTRNSKGRLKGEHLGAIFQEIFAISRNIERPQTVAVLGDKGSFSGQAALKVFGKTAKYKSYVSLDAIFGAVSSSRVRYGVVPIENNQEGTVQQTINNLSRRSGEGVRILSEVAIPIQFCLASRSRKLSSIQALHSRDIAFVQCSNFIDQHFSRGVPRIYTNSTIEACMAASKDESAGAVCSPDGARKYGLHILDRHITDSMQNKTRFLVISNQQPQALPTGSDKTSIVAWIPDDPGALATFLQDFKERKINLLKIQSSPARDGTRFKYSFFIEFEGNSKDPEVRRMLESYGDRVTWLGSYPRNCEHPV